MRFTLHRWFPALTMAALFLGGPAVLASGFHVYEQGAKGSAQAAAVIARADDASAIWYNPAGMVHFDRPVLSVGFSGVYLGDIKIDSTMNTVPRPGFDRFFTGGTWDMHDHISTPIHLYYGRRLGNSRFAVGLAVTTPFGLATDWSIPSNFDGRFAAVKTDLRAFVYNLNGAVDLGSGFSAAIGIDYLKAELKDFSRRVGPINVGSTEPVFIEPLLNLTGDGHKTGWNAALQWKSQNWAVGLTYRSEFSVKVDGNTTFTDRPAMLAGLLPDTPASGKLDLPATMGLGVAYLGFEKLQLEFDWHRIGWSSFKSIDIDFLYETPALRDKAVPENWKDTDSFRLGCSYEVVPGHQLRAGFYVENSPIPDQTLRPSIPDNDRQVFSFGYGFDGKDYGLDFYFMRINTKDKKISNELSAAHFDANAMTDPYGVVAGTYRSTVDLAGVTVFFKF